MPPPLTATLSSPAANFTVQTSSSSSSVNQTWIIAQLITVTLAAFTARMLHTFVIHGRRANKWTLRSAASGSSTLAILAVCACVAMLCSLVTTQALVVLALLELRLSALDSACFYLKRVKHTTAICSYTFANAFLWWRINTLYSQPSLSRFKNRRFWFTNAAAVLLFAVSFSFFAFLLGSSEWRGNHQRTCKSNKLSSKVLNFSVSYSFLGTRVATSLIMVALLSYPLLVDKKDNCHALSQSSSAGGGCGGGGGGGGGGSLIMFRDTRKMIKKKITLAAISVTVCVASHVVTELVQKLLLPANTLRAVDSSLWDVNDFVNVWSLLFCYFTHREMSDCCKGRPEVTSSSSLSPAGY